MRTFSRVVTLYKPASGLGVSQVDLVVRQFERNTSLTDRLAFPRRSRMLSGRMSDRSEMPRGPKGEKRPADVVGTAIMVAKIATGEIEDTTRDPAKAHARRGGQKGGRVRADRLTDQQRSKIARVAAEVRWKKSRS